MSGPKILATLAFALVIAACRPTIEESDDAIAARHASCTLERRDLDIEPGFQDLLQIQGRLLGEVRAFFAANDYATKLTKDGYWLRRTMSGLVIALGFLCVGALAASFLLTLKKRPPPRWGAELAKAVEREAKAMKGHATQGDALTQELVRRADEVLGAAVIKAEQLAGRCRPLEERADSATAIAHLQSLYRQIEGLLGRVERAHMHIVAWMERRGRDEDEVVKSQLQAAVDELAAALTEVPA